MNARTSRKLILIATSVFCLAGTLLLFGRLVRNERPPNLLLIVIDTLRADHVSCYGYDRIQTPNIDSLARKGVLFESASSHVPITLPALSTIMTSTLPVDNEVHVNEGAHLDESVHTLAEILRGEGYQTCGVVAAVVLDSATGIAQGFRHYDDDFPEFTCYLPSVEELKSQYDHTQRRAEDVTNEALKIASTMTNDPFFLFVHYFDPHTPKDPPPPYSNINPNEPVGSRENQIRLYDGEIAYTDAQIGRLMQGLGDRGLLENTLIVLTADHGEGLGDHGENTHAFFVYDQTIHIPLIFTMPGKIRQDQVSSRAVAHIDIAPTILDILGIEWRGKYGFQGSSLYPFDEESGSDTSYFECISPFVMYGWSGLRGVRTREWKYIDAPVDELYNLIDDPGEQENLIASKPDIARTLRREMEQILSMNDREAVDVSGSGREERPIDPAFQEKLRALGYVGAMGDVATEYEEMFDKSLPDPKDKITDFHASMVSNHYTRLGIVLIEKGSLGSAVDRLQTALELDPNNFSACYYLGLAYARSSEYESGVKMFERALKLKPSYLQAGLGLVDLYLLQGDSVTARTELEEIFSRGIETQTDLIRAARLWGRLGEGERMLDILERVLKENPEDVPARLYIGEHYLEAGKFDSAFPYLEPLLSAMDDGDSLAARVYYGLGGCYYHRGDLSHAIGMYQRVVALDSTTADGYIQLGVVYDELGEYVMAIENYQKALKLDPGLVEAHSNLGVSYYKLGRYDESIAEFEAYLPHVKDSREADRVRAIIEHIKGM